MKTVQEQLLKEFIEKYFVRDGEISVEKVVDLEEWLSQAFQRVEADALDRGRKEFGITVFNELKRNYGQVAALKFWKELAVSLRKPIVKEGGTGKLK